ncbi:hypothetical protein ERM63_19335 [Clostridioides difficile]|nr:hypothetical protein [Clostridioides difficile]GEM59456.1 hypothetical protein LR1_01380 [Lacticaseibacillus rhamnosus DSM 20021 = JCM 1136 = NBRC 3425]
MHLFRFRCFDAYIWSGRALTWLRKIEAVRKINNKRANGYSGAVGLTLFKTTKKLICLFDTV